MYAPAISAADVRRIAEEATSIDGPYGKVEFTKCMNDIRAAAKKGQYSCYVDLGGSHAGVVRKRLEALGFIVKTTNDQRDGDFTTVSW